MTKKRVTGLGGVFFKCKDVEKTKSWYSQHLGIQSNEYGGLFRWRDNEDPDKKCLTAWSPFPANTKYFKPGKQAYMFNYRVDNLEELLKILEKEGVEIVGEVETYDYGKFGWVLDPDGNKIELWEPQNEDLFD